MATEDNLNQARYTRWQGLALAQFSVAIGLISALAIAGLGTGLSLAQNHEFTCALIWKRTFVSSLPLLFFATGFSVLAVISRTLDFRLTARVARAATSASPRKSKFLGMGPTTLGKVSWACFWISCLTFFAGVSALAFSIANTYLVDLW